MGLYEVANAALGVFDPVIFSEREDVEDGNVRVSGFGTASGGKKSRNLNQHHNRGEDRMRAYLEVEGRILDVR